jgi:alkanesulfonate monooxygenase SsuD/methylene tetrahydromethanopterin reductase-like flavin-dependent oxidoreductase (luciferase family)
VTVIVGYQPPPECTIAPALPRAELLRHVADLGIDHIGLSDHISFQGGNGFDSIVHATAVLATEPRLNVLIGALLLPLRDPSVLARQIADVASMAPGQLTIAIGVGGEDRREIANCGVDPSSRGRRADEAMHLLRRLLDGEVIDHAGEFFQLDRALVLPTPIPRVPLMVAGRSSHGVRRAGRVGDGWLGLWVSPERFSSAMAEAHAIAGDRPLEGAMVVWCGFDDEPAVARAHLATSMRDLYGLPFDKFERYCPTGPPQVIAEFLAPYVAAGCRTFTLIARGADPFAVAEGVATVRRLLATDEPIDLRSPTPTLLP